MKNKPSYYSIIPATVRYDKDLSANAKLLYAEITSLTNMNGQCNASTNYFAELYNVSKTSVQNWLKQLDDKGYIERVVTYKDNSKEIDNRYINLLNYPTQEKLCTPTQEKLSDNNSTKVHKNNTNTKDSFIQGCDEKLIPYISKWLNYRKNLKLPEQWEFQYKKLKQFNNPEEVVEYSIGQGYTGLYPPKNSIQQSKPTMTQEEQEAWNNL